MNPFQPPRNSDPRFRSRGNTVEVIVVLAICAILYGLTLPGVGTNCVGRRAVIQPFENP